VAIAAVNEYSAALKSDGTVVAWGGYDESGQTDVPAGLSGVVAIATGVGHMVALKSDGTVVAWGYGQTVPAGLSGVAAIAAGAGYTVALKSDGTVVAWGVPVQNLGQTDVPVGLSGVTAIAAGWGHTLALKSDGTVVAWGFNNDSQTTIPAGLSGVTAIAAGEDHSLAITTIAELPIRILVDGVFVPNGAVVRDRQAAIGLYTAFTNAMISYSTDGTAPFIGGPSTYTGTFTITSNTTIRALAVNLDDSSTAESDPVMTYIIYPPALTTAGGGTMAMSSSSSNSVVTITAIPDPGWAFISWSGAATGTNATDTVIADQPKAVQAIFGTTVNTTTPGYGSILISPASGPYPFGSTVHLAAEPTSGYYFVNWDGAATGSVNPLNYTIATANPTVSALFAQAPLDQTIIFGALPDKNLGNSPVALNATASSGLPVSYFILSGPAIVTGNTLTITGGGAVVVRALQSGSADYSAAANVDQSFTVYLTLTTSAGQYGALTRDPDLAQYTNGAVVLLTATPYYDATFTGWSGSASGIINSLPVVMDTNKNITANFVTTNAVIGKVQLVSLDFNPKTVDFSYAAQTVTVTVHLMSSGAPITQATVSFSHNVANEPGLGLILGPQNLVSGDLYDGVFQGTISLDYYWTHLGTYTLTQCFLLDQSGRYKDYEHEISSTDPGEAMFPFPTDTPTSLVITAPNHPGMLGMQWPGCAVDSTHGWICNPIFTDTLGNFFSDVPCAETGRRYVLQRGETRPFMCISGNWLMFSGRNMNVSCTIDAAPDTELQSDIGIRLVRAWTKNDTPGWGELQRDFLISPPDGALGSELYEISMLSNGSNAPTWSVMAGFVITPPPGGFKRSFKLTFTSLQYADPLSETGVAISLFRNVLGDFH
jgi:hypothetical protein